MALSPYDQSVYDAGYKYIPQSQYLLNPYAIPQGTENEVPAGIPTVYQPRPMISGGGDGGQNMLGPDTRGYIGNYQGMNFNDMYSYTPQGITIEDVVALSDESLFRSVFFQSETAEFNHDLIRT